MDKRTIQILILVSLTLTNCFSQNCDEFEMHLNSVNYSNSRNRSGDSLYNPDRSFIDYTIQNLLIEPADSCFISNRKLLRKFKTEYCDSSMITIRDDFSDGDQCLITLKTEVFEPDKHMINTNEDSSYVKEIDGQFPFGGQYHIPITNISKLEIKINGNQIKLPDHIYKNLYDPNLCEEDPFMRSIEAYESLDGQFLYLYIFGGNAAGTYFAKLIFNKNEYKTKIISDYYPLSIHGSFRKGFIGF